MTLLTKIGLNVPKIDDRNFIIDFQWELTLFYRVGPIENFRVLPIEKLSYSFGMRWGAPRDNKIADNFLSAPTTVW